MKAKRGFQAAIYILLAITTIIMPVIVKAQTSRPVIIISPGHGWWDEDSQKIAPGVVNGDLIEKDINLDVARYVRTYLSRCPVDVHLTRDGDDPDHTLEDVDEIVNGYNPTVGVSIHTNSFTGLQTGTEGWYTVNGFDDENSQKLAALLSGNIASRLEIRNIGTKPETQNRYGGLYIHNWDAPSALIEIAEIHGDAELLRNRKDDFGRSIAQAILEYLEIDPHCADWSIPQGLLISTYFPRETKTNDINLLNDGLVVWRVQDYSLVNQGNEYGAEAIYPLSQQTPVKEIATWDIPAVAPNRPGIFRQEWQLVRGEDQVGNKITVYLIVVPEEARQIKEDIDRRIEELRQRGEEEIERFIEQLEQEALEWVTRELPNLICGQNVMLIGFTIGLAWVVKSKRR